MSDTFASRYGPWAVVTGASSGIGRAFAHELARRSLSVALVARRRADLEELAQDLRQRHGTTTRVLVADLGERDAPARVLDEVADLDVGLFVGAAGFGSSGPLLAADPRREADMIDVNCRAVLELTHGLGHRLQARGRGGLILLSSIVAFQGASFATNYAATKAYVQSLAEGLRVELAKSGVRVVACAPGPIHSEFAARAGMRLGAAQAPAIVAVETLRRLDRGGTVRPGWLAKLLGVSLSLLPRWARVQVMRRIMGGMVDGRNR